jgi:hypothetical protein
MHARLTGKQPNAHCYHRFSSDDYIGEAHLLLDHLPGRVFAPLILPSTFPSNSLVRARRRQMIILPKPYDSENDVLPEIQGERRFLKPSRFFDAASTTRILKASLNDHSPLPAS